jgi:hypothetical protein
MGYDTTYTEYHLTPNGWVEGNWWSNEPPQNSAPPVDRIETWLLKETTHDPYIYRITKDWVLIWKSPDYMEEDRKRMRAKIRNEVVIRPNPFRCKEIDFPIEE